jgi:hypothetical protein
MLISGRFGTETPVVFLFQSFAAGLVYEFAPPIGVQVPVEPAQGDPDHVAVADLRTRCFLG